MSSETSETRNNNATSNTEWVSQQLYSLRDFYRSSGDFRQGPDSTRVQERSTNPAATFAQHPIYLSLSCDEALEQAVKMQEKISSVRQICFHGQLLSNILGNTCFMRTGTSPKAAASKLLPTQESGAATFHGDKHTLVLTALIVAFVPSPLPFLVPKSKIPIAMPRVESRTSVSQLYHHESPSHYPSMDSYPSVGQPSAVAQAPAPPAAKKKHICPTCERAFTTSGHLARHSRVHTGERNHKCPFPGCETRCSRQDNLQQQIHLSPGSRRSSNRSALTRVVGSTRRGGMVESSSSVSSASPPPLASPPALEPARVYTEPPTRVYTQVSPPPDSPPALAHATLPATAQLPESVSLSSRGSSSPDSSYSQSHMTSSQFAYRTYQEQQQSQYPYASGSSGSSWSSHSYLPHINTSVSNGNGSSHSPSPVSSRHSLNHISPPYQDSTSPPSPSSAHPISSSSQHPQRHSGPSTPTYTGYPEEEYHGNGVVRENSNGSMISSDSQLVHAGYSPTAVSSGYSPTVPSATYSHSPTVEVPTRYESPRPILAPLPGFRREETMMFRREEEAAPMFRREDAATMFRREEAPRQHHAYMHHPQSDFGAYHQHGHHELGLWKKGIVQ
ncbi:hypothetical protein C8J56DRAFT_901732 [Mycena floridula]|nr:hypothetical protein C8J56DRAFT_901732 [Mycena floridula]